MNALVDHMSAASNSIVTSIYGPTAKNQVETSNISTNSVGIDLYGCSSLSVWARPPKPGTQLLGMPPQVLDQASPLFLSAYIRGRGGADHQFRCDVPQTIVECTPPVLYGG